MDVSVLLYKTYRRPFGDKYDDEWVPWYNLAYGAEIDDVLSVVVGHAVQVVLCDYLTCLLSAT